MFGTLFLTVAIATGPAQAAPTPPAGRIESTVAQIVRELGTNNDSDPGASIQTLHAAGREAVPLLLTELAVVDPDPHVTPGDAWWHMVWTERALRSLTGQYFKFPSKEQLPSDLAEFRKAGEPLGYAMEWMSHARVFIAPRDVQQQVLDAWSKWYVENRGTFVIRPYEANGDWFW